MKGTGQSAIEAILAAREEGGAFTSLFDFCNRVDRSRVNKRTVEALIKAGAFDKLHAERASMVASIGLAFDYAETQAANANQGGLFDFGDSHAASTQEPALVAAELVGAVTGLGQIRGGLAVEHPEPADGRWIQPGGAALRCLDQRSQLVPGGRPALHELGEGLGHQTSGGWWQTARGRLRACSVGRRGAG